MVKSKNVIRNNLNLLSDSEKTESNQWQSSAIKAIWAIKNLVFSPLWFHWYV
jgi:hypothetical protein